jgi:hypothetical protein
MADIVALCTVLQPLGFTQAAAMAIMDEQDSNDLDKTKLLMDD